MKVHLYTLIAILFFACLTSANSKENEIAFLYKISDIGNDITFMQKWQVSKIEDSGDIVMEKTDITEEAAVYIEVESFWHTTFEKKAEDLYVKHSFINHPSTLLAGESSFGHIEMRKSKDDEPFFSWPSFVSVDMVKGLWRATTTVFMSDSKRWVIVRYYKEGGYYFPVLMLEEIFDGNGEREHLVIHEMVASTWKK